MNGLKGFSRATLGVALLWVVSPGAASATDIQAVTVYGNGATVTREHTIAVPAGTPTIEIPALPARANLRTLQVRVQGHPDATLYQVETRTVQERDLSSEQERKLNREIQTLEDRRRGLDDQRRANALRLQFIERLTESEIELAPEDWADAWERIGEGATAVLSRTASLDRKRRDLEAEIDRLERKLAAFQTRQSSVQAITLRLHAQTAGDASVQVTYEVPNASWQPLYEARLNTERDKLELVQFATVRQNSGEDWTDATLRLSTSRPDLGGRLPDLQPWTLDFKSDMPTPTMAAPASRRASPDALDMRLAGTESLAAFAPQTVIETRGISHVYRVPGSVTLAADNREQRFELDRHALSATIEAHAVPALSKRAHIVARATFAGDVALIPGRLSLFQDGNRAGETRLDATVPGSKLHLTFGPDERIEIERVALRDVAGQTGLIRRSSSHDLGHTFRVTNRHSQSRAIHILDRMPVPRDERIEVRMARDSAPPDVKDVNGRPGIVAWERTVEPGATQEIRVGYTVSWPESAGPVEGLQR